MSSPRSSAGRLRVAIAAALLAEATICASAHAENPLPSPTAGGEAQESTGATTEPAEAAAARQLNAEHEIVSSTQKQWGWMALSLSTVLAQGAGLFLYLHYKDIGTVESECPGGRCTFDEQPQANNTQYAARTYEDVAIALMATSGVALVGGIVLFTTVPRVRAVTLTVGAPGALPGGSVHVAF